MLSLGPERNQVGIWLGKDKCPFPPASVEAELLKWRKVCVHRWGLVSGWAACERKLSPKPPGNASCVWRVSDIKIKKLLPSRKLHGCGFHVTLGIFFGKAVPHSFLPRGTWMKWDSASKCLSYPAGPLEVAAENLNTWKSGKGLWWVSIAAAEALC